MHWERKGSIGHSRVDAHAAPHGDAATSNRQLVGGTGVTARPGGWPRARGREHRPGGEIHRRKKRAGRGRAALGGSASGSRRAQGETWHSEIPISGGVWPRNPPRAFAYLSSPCHAPHDDAALASAWAFVAPSPPVIVALTQNTVLEAQKQRKTGQAGGP